jgi:integrase
MRKRTPEKEAPALDQVLTFTDVITGLQREVRMKDLIFVNFRTGEPTKNSTYDTNLYKICDKAGIRPFCMHALRHTFATRCIERGVNPKSLQKILGHAHLSTTMDTYVHATDDSLEVAMKIFEAV